MVLYGTLWYFMVLYGTLGTLGSLGTLLYFDGTLWYLGYIELFLSSFLSYGRLLLGHNFLLFKVFGRFFQGILY